VSAARGADASSGTSANPWKTISKAAASVPPGSKVIAEAGSYPEMVTIASAGTAVRRIVFEGDRTNGDVIINAQGKSTGFLLSGTAAYITIRGFKIQNASTNGIKVSQNAEGIEILDCAISGSGGQGVFLDRSKSTTLRHVKTQSNSIGLDVNEVDGLVVENLLASGNTGAGLKVRGTTNGSIRNLTSRGNNQGAYFTAGGTRTLSDSILASNTAEGIYKDGGTGSTLSNNDVWSNGTNYRNCTADPASISADPLFVDAAGGNFRLQQVAAGQAADSPCLNAGSRSAADAGLADRTTRTDNVADADAVDLGWHEDPGLVADLCLPASRSLRQPLAPGLAPGLRPSRARFLTTSPIPPPSRWTTP